MARIEIVHAADRTEEAGHPCGYATTGAVSARRVSPDGFPLWLATLTLENGASVEVPDVHGDEAFFVDSGVLGSPTGPETVGADGAVVVESGVPAVVQAIGETRVIHMGPADPVPPDGGRLGPPEVSDRGVHWIGPGGRWYFGYDEVGYEGDGGHYYLDGSCPTCRLSLHLMHHLAGYDQEAHSHSEDELLHVLRGAIRVGSRVVGPGDTLAISCDVRYRFTSPNGFVLVNYRRNASVMSFPDRRPAVVEGAASHGLPAR